MSEEQKIFPTFDAYKEGSPYFDEYKDSYQCVWNAAYASAEAKYKLSFPDVTKDNVGDLLAAIVNFNPDPIITAARVLQRKPSYKDHMRGIVPHTYNGFKAVYFMANQSRPHEQEIFDAGVKAGREIAWLARHYEAIAVKNINSYSRNLLQFTTEERKEIAETDVDQSDTQALVEKLEANRQVPMEAISKVLLSLLMNDDIEYANKVLAVYDADCCPQCKYVKHHCRCPDKKS